MKKKDVFDSQLLFIPLFWGSLWGIAEASLGHLLHLVGFPGLAGIVMFPLGLFFMTKAFIISGKKRVIFFTALIAGSLKLTDLFFPVSTPFVVLNPALAIVFESLVVMLFLPGKSWIEGRMRLGRLLGMAVSWRVLYAVFVLGLSFFFPVNNFLNLGLSHAVNFFLLESAASGLLLFLLFQSKFYFRNDYSSVLRLLSKSTVSLFVFLVVLFVKFLV
jgi:hypothetical protein